jgi:MoaA/NifB/PqqE/SkfB family radical SAM enzyme
MTAHATPLLVIWDITYACPLRCSHCYSESGRRPSRQLRAEDLYRVTDALTSLKPAAIILAGGEPLVVRELFDVARRISGAGVEPHVYTNGWALDPAMVPSVVSQFSRVTVSLDGATAEVHDRIRGRAGSFDRALEALSKLDAALRDCRRRGEWGPALGIDFVVMRSNFHQVRTLCETVVPRFPAVEQVSFGAVIPSGLATRADFAELEMLTDEQAGLLADGRLAQELQSCVPPSVTVRSTDNRDLQMHPDVLAQGAHTPLMQVEPDGRVRAMPIYEGTVGSLLSERPQVLWERAVARWNDPFVVRTLKPARTMREWADAARRIDQHFASAQDNARVARRSLYTLPANDARVTPSCH